MTSMSIDAANEKLAEKKVQPFISDGSESFVMPEGWRSMTGDDLRLGMANAAYMFTDEEAPVSIFIFGVETFKRTTRTILPRENRARVNFYATSGPDDANHRGNEFSLNRYMQTFDDRFLIKQEG